MPPHPSSARDSTWTVQLRLHFRFPSFRDLPKHLWRGRRAVQQPNIPAELPCDSHQALQRANVPLSSSAPKGCFNYCLFLNRPEHDPTCFCYSFTRQHGHFRLLTGIIYCPWLFLALGDGISLGMEGICWSGKVSLFHGSSRFKGNYPKEVCQCSVSLSNISITVIICNDWLPVYNPCPLTLLGKVMADLFQFPCKTFGEVQ